MRVTVHKLKRPSDTHSNGRWCPSQSHPLLSRHLALTLRLFEPLNQVLEWIFGLVDDQGAHHVFKYFVETLLLDVLFAAALEVNLLLFQHHDCSLTVLLSLNY